MTTPLTIRNLRPEESEALGKLLGSFTEKPGARVLVALSPAGELVGGVVYFADMAQYGSGGAATSVPNASGIRLLGVDPKLRRSGAGKALTQACIRLAQEQGHAQVVLHTTQAMQVAWGLYESLGFERSPDLDFSQQDLQVFGFRLQLAGAGVPVLERFDHFHVYVVDRAAAERWYADVLGFRRVPELECWAADNGPQSVRDHVVRACGDRGAAGMNLNQAPSSRVGASQHLARSQGLLQGARCR